jgi:hypothetical protein
MLESGTNQQCNASKRSDDMQAADSDILSTPCHLSDLVEYIRVDLLECVCTHTAVDLKSFR